MQSTATLAVPRRDSGILSGEIARGDSSPGEWTNPGSSGRSLSSRRDPATTIRPSSGSHSTIRRAGMTGWRVRRQCRTRTTRSRRRRDHLRASSRRRPDSRRRHRRGKPALVRGTLRLGRQEAPVEVGSVGDEHDLTVASDGVGLERDGVVHGDAAISHVDGRDGGDWDGVSQRARDSPAHRERARTVGCLRVDPLDDADVGPVVHEGVARLRLGCRLAIARAHGRSTARPGSCGPPGCSRPARRARASREAVSRREAIASARARIASELRRSTGGAGTTRVT